jgi:hypothetical protein
MVTTEDGKPSQDGKPARLFAGLGFLYTFVVIVGLLAFTDFLNDEPDPEVELLWLMVPLTSSLFAWLAARAGFAPLRAWVWFGIAATTFFCWIAIFSFGLLFVPVPVLMMMSVVSPWDTPEQRARRVVEVAEATTGAGYATQATHAGGWLWTSPVAQHGREVGYPRRLLGDEFLELALIVATLGVGWLIWFAIVARKGQTPAKSLVRVTVHDYGTGGVASVGKMWLREIVGKRLVPVGVGLVGFLVTGSEAAWGASEVYTLAAALLVVTTVDRRTIWDYIAGTTVRLHA